MFKNALVLVLYMGALAYMSLGTRYPQPVQSLFEELGSTVLHALGYALLTILFGLVLPKRRRRSALSALILAFSYGFVLEVAQVRVPGRSFSVVDLLVNLVGSAWGGLGLAGYREG